MIRVVLFLGATLLINNYMCIAQLTSSTRIKWWNPKDVEYPVLQGQAWHQEVKSFYDRLPERAEKSIRDIVWQLSHDAAGLKVEFKTDASNIHVRYTVVNKNYAMSHFPATGVSGVDLYVLNNDGIWDWADGSFNFGDTITYSFDNLDLDERNCSKGKSFHLYLPLYNQVKWLEIGVSENSYFEFKPTRKQKPIVVYGTSIAQGGCASRPGMAWTAILERSIYTPLINLGFSGNAKMESELIKLLQEIDARIFILDCLPNLDANTTELSLSVEKKYIEGVLALREKYADTPILLTEHSGDILHKLDSSRRKSVLKLNYSLRQAFNQLKERGIHGIYLLTANEIGLDIESTVDGLHPTDLGMVKYAQAYKKKLQEIFKEVNTTTIRIE